MEVKLTSIFCRYVEINIGEKHDIEKVGIAVFFQGQYRQYREI